MHPEAGKHVVITGITRGLGRALALEFANRGYTVNGCGRSSGGLESLRGELGTVHGAALETGQVDVTDRQAIAAWAAWVLDEYGAPDYLINNAGVINQPAPLWEIEVEEFERVVAVNLNAVFSVCRAFVPAMVERGTGVIVNFSSGWGRSASPVVGPYNASKYGLEGLTKSLALALPEGMVAVPLSPGVIDTDMLRTAWGDAAAAHPAPAEWARRAVPFLLALDASDSGRSLTIPD